MLFDERALDPRPLALLRVVIAGHTTHTLWSRGPWREGSLSSIMTEVPRFLWEPVGVWSWVDAPPPGGVILGLYVAVMVLGTLSTLGIKTRVVLPAFALVFLSLTTLDQCWSRLEENRIFTALVLLMLSGTRCADAYAVDTRAPAEPHGRYRWPLHAVALLWGSILFVAGTAKLRTSGLVWADSDNLRNILLSNNLGMPGREPGVVALWLVDHPVLCRFSAGLTLLSELAVLPLVLTRDARAIAVAGLLSAVLLLGFWWLLRVPQTPHVVGLLAFVPWDAVLGQLENRAR